MYLFTTTTTRATAAGDRPMGQASVMEHRASCRALKASLVDVSRQQHGGMWELQLKVLRRYTEQAAVHCGKPAVHRTEQEIRCALEVISCIPASQHSRVQQQWFAAFCEQAGHSIAALNNMSSSALRGLHTINPPSYLTFGPHKVWFMYIAALMHDLHLRRGYTLGQSWGFVLSMVAELAQWYLQQLQSAGIQGPTVRLVLTQLNSSACPSLQQWGAVRCRLQKAVDDYSSTVGPCSEDICAAANFPRDLFASLMQHRYTMLMPLFDRWAACVLQATFNAVPSLPHAIKKTIVLQMADPCTDQWFVERALQLLVRALPALPDDAVARTTPSAALLPSVLGEHELVPDAFACSTAAAEQLALHGLRVHTRVLVHVYNCVRMWLLIPLTHAVPHEASLRQFESTVEGLFASVWCKFKDEGFTVHWQHIGERIKSGVCKPADGDVKKYSAWLIHKVCLRKESVHK